MCLCMMFFILYFAIVNKHTNCILLCFVGDSAPCGALSSSTDKMTFIRNLNMQMHNTFPPKSRLHSEAQHPLKIEEEKNFINSNNGKLKIRCKNTFHGIALADGVTVHLLLIDLLAYNIFINYVK